MKKRYINNYIKVLLILTLNVFITTILFANDTPQADEEKTTLDDIYNKRAKTGQITQLIGSGVATLTSGVSTVTSSISSIKVEKIKETIVSCTDSFQDTIPSNYDGLLTLFNQSASACSSINKKHLESIKNLNLTSAILSGVGVAGNAASFVGRVIKDKNTKDETYTNISKEDKGLLSYVDSYDIKKQENKLKNAKTMQTAGAITSTVGNLTSTVTSSIATSKTNQLIKDIQSCQDSFLGSTLDYDKLLLTYDIARTKCAKITNKKISDLKTLSTTSAIASGIGTAGGIVDIVGQFSEISARKKLKEYEIMIQKVKDDKEFLLYDCPNTIDYTTEKIVTRNEVLNILGVSTLPVGFAVNSQVPIVGGSDKEKVVSYFNKIMCYMHEEGSPEVQRNFKVLNYFMPTLSVEEHATSSHRGMAGYYVDAEKKIVIIMDSFANSGINEITQTFTHELEHFKQDMLIQLPKRFGSNLGIRNPELGSDFDEMINNYPEIYLLVNLLYEADAKIVGNSAAPNQADIVSNLENLLNIDTYDCQTNADGSQLCGYTCSPWQKFYTGGLPLDSFNMVEKNTNFYNDLSLYLDLLDNDNENKYMTTVKEKIINWVKQDGHLACTNISGNELTQEEVDDIMELDVIDNLDWSNRTYTQGNLVFENKTFNNLNLENLSIKEDTELLDTQIGFSVTFKDCIINNSNLKNIIVTGNAINIEYSKIFHSNLSNKFSDVSLENTELNHVDFSLTSIGDTERVIELKDVTLLDVNFENRKLQTSKLTINSNVSFKFSEFLRPTSLQDSIFNCGVDFTASNSYERSSGYITSRLLDFSGSVFENIDLSKDRDLRETLFNEGFNCNSEPY